MKIGNIQIVKKESSFYLEMIVVFPTLGWTNLILRPKIASHGAFDDTTEFVISATPPFNPIGSAIETKYLSQKLEGFNGLGAVKVIEKLSNKETIINQVSIKQSLIGKDTVYFEPLGFREDNILIDVKYYGGCRSHGFRLNWDDDDQFQDDCKKVSFTLSHNANGDPSKVLVKHLLQFKIPENMVLKYGDLIEINSLDETTMIEYQPNKQLKILKRTVNFY